jgi:cytoskeletal protein RodZ
MSAAPTGNSTGGGVPADEIRDAAIGARLRSARNRNELSLATVAEQLHLDTAIIQAIESDDQAALPEPIFVQGYVRSYARLVGLPEDELVRQYIAQSKEPPPLTAIRADSKTSLIHLPSARLVRTVMLVLLVGVLMWLAYPLLVRFIESRSGIVEEQLPGRLELPPAYEEQLTPESPRQAE